MIIILDVDHIFFLYRSKKTYDNVVMVTMDELPPPFVEGDYIKSAEKIVADESITPDECQTSAISSLPPNNNNTVIIEDEREEEHQGSNS